MKKRAATGLTPSPTAPLLLLAALFAGLAAGAEPAPSRWPACNPDASSQTLSFVHLSDVHANYNPDRSGSSPLARARGFYEQTRAENPYTLFTDAGDDYEKGSIAELLSAGQTTRRIVQSMGYDVRTLGNHDFAWGLDELLAFSHDPTAIVLASNIRAISPPAPGNSAATPGWSSYGELTVGCLRVGFFGLVSQPWNEKDEPYGGSFYPELEADFHYAEAAREMVARHRGEVDLLVLVSHLGIHEDIRLARSVEGIDLILGGHTHTTLQKPVTIGSAAIVHVGGHAENLARVDLEFDLQGRTLRDRRFTLVPNGPAGGVPPDRPTELAIEKILDPFAEAMAHPFAWVSAPLGRDAAAEIAARAAVESLGVDAALVGVRTAWGGWEPGALTRQAVLDAFKVEREPVGTPGFSSLYRVEVSGRDLMQVSSALKGFVFRGPDRIDPDRRYTLALQKPQAFHQEESFGRRIGSQQPQPVAELWEAVVAYGQARDAARLAIDSDAPASGREELIAFLPAAPGTTDMEGMQ